MHRKYHLPHRFRGSHSSIGSSFFQVVAPVFIADGIDSLVLRCFLGGRKCYCSSAFRSSNNSRCRFQRVVWRRTLKELSIFSTHSRRRIYWLTSHYTFVIFFPFFALKILTRFSQLHSIRW